jgi:protein-tyrosine phosphatase
MGNICRSPTAEAVFRRAVEKAGMHTRIECDSAGTHGYHIGEPPDRRAQFAAKRRGYDMNKLRGRKVCREDFEQFDYIAAMDRRNFALLEQQCPPEHAGKLKLYCDFDEQYAGSEVPDPYYGESGAFEKVLDMIETVNASLVEKLCRLMRQ